MYNKQINSNCIILQTVSSKFFLRLSCSYIELLFILIAVGQIICLVVGRSVLVVTY